MSGKQQVTEQTTELSLFCDDSGAKSVDQQEFNTELNKYYNGDNKKKSRRFEWTSEKIGAVMKLIEDYNSPKTIKRTSRQYYYDRRYDICIDGGKKVLTLKRKHFTYPPVQIIPSSEYYKRIHIAHILTNHGGRQRIVKILKDEYIYVPVYVVKIFLKLCKTCCNTRKGNNSNDIAETKTMNRIGQVDLIDFQTSPDNEFKWLMHYQDHLTKFNFLRPLKTDEAREVAVELLKIFLEFICPNILQSNKGGEFRASILKEIISLWPESKVVIVQPICPEDNKSVECCTQDVKRLVEVWMKDNNSTNWSVGCYFAQLQKNSSLHSTIVKTPYEALFGYDPKRSPSFSYLSKTVNPESESEEEMEENFKGNGNICIQNASIGAPKTIKSQNILMEDSNVRVCSVKISPDNPSKNLKEDLSDTGYNVIMEENTVIISSADTLSNNSTAVKSISSSILICHICNEEVIQAHICPQCNNVIHKHCGVLEEHENYGLQLLCNMCVKEMKVVKPREELVINFKRKRLREENIIDLVSLPKITKIVHEPLSNINIDGAKIKKDVLNKSNLGTSRKLVILAPAGTLYKNTLNLESLRSTVSSLNIGKGTKCSCKSKCATTNCPCRKMLSRCHSKCHARRTRPCENI